MPKRTWEAAESFEMEPIGDLDLEMVEEQQPPLFCMPDGTEIQTLASEMKRQKWDWKLPRQCPICGKEFVPNNGKQRYCSDLCWYKKRYRDRVEHSKSEIGFCQWCGKKMVAGPSGWAWGLKYCSRRCQGLAWHYNQVRRGTCNGFTKENAAERGKNSSRNSKKKKENDNHGNEK